MDSIWRMQLQWTVAVQNSRNITIAAETKLSTAAAHVKCSLCEQSFTKVKIGRKFGPNLPISRN